MTAFKLLYPVDMARCVVTQRFGENPADYARFGIKGHNGLDIGSYGGAGVPIMAVDNGVVSLAAWDTTGYGFRVDIKHSWGRSLYGHMVAAPIVKVGQTVKAGDKLGTMGSTGNSSGTHLHLGIYPVGVSSSNGYNGAIDPAPLLGDAVPVDEPPVDVTPVTLPAWATFTASPAVRLSPSLSGKQIGRVVVGARVKVERFIQDGAIIWAEYLVPVYSAYEQNGNKYMEFE